MKLSDSDDLYYAQREELIERLKTHVKKSEYLIVYDRILLSPDEMQLILRKIWQEVHFSRKEKDSLIEAGFNIDKIFPNF